MLQVLHRILDRIRAAREPEHRAGPAIDERVFHRPALAEDLAASLMSRSYASGMFLTAPRRTGKSTFIRHDLIPALERQHRALVLYADLWEHRAEDPGAVIVGLVARALKARKSAAQAVLERFRLSRLKVPGLELDMDKAAPAPALQPSLRQSLERLSNLTRRTVVLIVDEAQHTQTTAYGREVMFMLKSARDQLSNRELLMFRLLMTGSHHAKIERLVRYKHEAFYCAPLKAMPTLGGEDYFEWERAAHAPAFLPALDAMGQAFEICLRRPEVFHIACQAASARVATTAESQEQLLLRMARRHIDAERQEFLHRLMKLDPLDQAVLRSMAEAGPSFAPFFPAAGERISALLAAMPGTPARPTSPGDIRAALTRLCEANLVWSGDGPYVLEDAQAAVWLRELELSRLTADSSAAALAAIAPASSGSTPSRRSTRGAPAVAA